MCLSFRSSLERNNLYHLKIKGAQRGDAYLTKTPDTQLYSVQYKSKAPQCQSSMGKQHLKKHFILLLYISSPVRNEKASFCTANWKNFDWFQKIFLLLMVFGLETFGKKCAESHNLFE